MKILDVPQSGSVAGVTSSRNRFGQYRRTRAIPVQPRTPKQGQIRAYFTVGSSGWRSLTDAQRTAWNDYAAQITRSNSLGSGYSPTGAELFSGATVASGGATITTAPLTLPAYYLIIGGMAYVDPTPGPEALTVILGTTNADNKILIETSGPVSPGITSSAAVRSWRSLPGTSGNLYPNSFSMAASPVAILAQYKFLFPSPPSGSTIWFRFREIFYAPLDTVPVVNKQIQTFRLIIP